MALKCRFVRCIHMSMVQMAKCPTQGSASMMKRFTLLSLLGMFFLSISSFGQTLTDEQVIAAINRALSGKRHQIGLMLNDVQTNVFSGLACKTCKTTGYTIFVYTPESWIELKAIQARREMLPFGLENVTPEMRLPYIHVLASPSRPEYLDANGMGMASSVHRVVLSSTDRSDVIQPLSESRDEVESNSALRSFTQSSAGAVFSMEDVARLRSEDPKREFFFVVVGDNQNKYFKVKTRFFNQLFGLNSDSAYAGPKSTSPEGGSRKKPTPQNTSENTATQTESVEGPTPKAIEAGIIIAGAHEARGELVHSRSTASATTPVVSTKPDIRTKAPNPISVASGALAGTRKTSATRNNAPAEVAGERYDVYQHDSALIAEWWNLRESDASGSSQLADPKSLTDGRFSTTVKSSIGAWCDEKPRISHDGVRIDRIAPAGPADEAGVRIGDNILALDGIYLFTAEELMNAIHRYKPGTRSR